MKKPIRFVYFDVGDVLLSNDLGMDRVAKTYGVSKQAVYDVIEAHWKLGCRGTLNNRDYMDIFTRKLHITHPSNDIADFWSDQTVAIQKMHDFIFELAPKYKLGLLSNAERGALAKQIHKGKIPNISWAAIIESAQHGTIKPEPRIYEIAEAASGVSPGEIFFVDDVSEHITMARARGWQGMVFDTKNVSASIKKLRTLL